MTQELELFSGVTLGRASIREGRRCRVLLRRLLRPLKGVDGAAAANGLIDYFGSLRATLAADAQEQLHASGDRRVVRYLGVIRQSMRWSLRDEVERRTLLAAPDALRAYLRFSHGSAQVEQLRVFYLNTVGGLLREHVFERGAPDQTSVCTAQVIKRGLELDARLLVMAHNHPSGDPTPSKQNRDVTRRIAIGAHAVGMTLYDRLIVAAADDFSFRENGLL